MTDLFSLEEFVSYLQVASFDTATATLARDLATTEIRLEVGPATYDALSDLTPFKAIALAVAKRSVINPGGLRSSGRQIDDYTENNTYAPETLLDAELTQDERDRIDRILGRTAGAFTIRASGEPDVPLYPRRCW
jgi:hypothetical protein